MAHRRLTGVLLVGGESRRFGSPKALARLDGETLAERGWRVLGEACEERLAVGKAADALALPFPVVDDGSEIRAPLAGIVAGLRAAPTEVVVVLPVDVPLATAELLHRLGDACADAAATQTGALPAAFHRRSLAVLERRLKRGDLAVRAALHELDTVVVEVDPRLTANVNAPPDLERLRDSLHTPTQGWG